MEGKSITNNLTTEVCVILLGAVNFNYAMKVRVLAPGGCLFKPSLSLPSPPSLPPLSLQEFCIIALVGLLCDFFLQIVFFPTVLSIDLRRMEVCLSIHLSHFHLFYPPPQLTDLKSPTMKG